MFVYHFVGHPALSEVSYKFGSVCSFISLFATQDLRIGLSGFFYFLHEVKYS